MKGDDVGDDRQMLTTLATKSALDNTPEIFALSG